ncbi:MAG TPA: nuclear transport factor 2 family protein [Candidatus Limnocylindria bacterium]|nr:nuclear transport factor 2 family protein [Candidatus Limnocylindria bacterium]
MSAAERAAVESWLAAYQRAWGTDDPDDVAALFTEDAIYSPWPFSKPWEGRDAIVAKWIERGDSKNPWTFDGEVLAVDGDTGVIKGLTTYPAHDDEAEDAYSNIWVVRLAPDGRARSFAEWWVQRPKAE